MTRIVGHYWDEYLQGGDGNDQIYAKGGNDEAHGGWGNDRVFGDAGSDYLTGDEGRDRVGGGAGDDGIWDGEGDYNVLDGGKGNDWVGGIGDLYGRDGDDIMYTMQGGGLQGTRLYGGNGHDTFQVNFDALSGTIYDPYDGHIVALGAPQHITIADFHPGSDMLKLTANDPLGNYLSNDQYGNGTVFAAFDSNHDNVLTRDDDYVNATADNKGLELQFWNVALEIDHVTALTTDFML